MNKKTAVILANVGTPDEPTRGAVRRFLFHFLNDKYVIDLPWLLRKFLVNGIIIPFRIKKSTKLYERLWTKTGSPIIYHTENLKEKLQKQLGDQFEVFIGMRNENPNYKKALKEIKNRGFERVVIFPLFPQYARAYVHGALAVALWPARQADIIHAVQDIRRAEQNFWLRTLSIPRQQADPSGALSE
jgi:ferrochelatase